MTTIAKEKRTKIFLAAGVIQLLFASAALSYFFYLKGNAGTAKSVGLAVKEAIDSQQRATTRPQSLWLRASNSAATKMTLRKEVWRGDGSRLQSIVFPQPQQTPDCAHLRIVPDRKLYSTGDQVNFEFQVIKAPPGVKFSGFEWTVKPEPGRIANGQGTRQIVVDTSNVNGTITVGLSIDDPGICVKWEKAPAIRQVPPPATPSATKNKMQRFQGRVDLDKYPWVTKAGIPISVSCGTGRVSITTDESGRFAFDTTERGRCSINVSRTTDTDDVKGSRVVELLDGKSDLGDFVVAVDLVATVTPPPATPNPSVSPTPSISPTTPTPTPTAESTNSPDSSTAPLSVSTKKTDTGEFSVNWPRALMRGEEGVVTVTYTPPEPGAVPRLNGTYSRIQLQLSATVTGLVLLGGPDAREFATLGGQPITWSYPFKVKDDSGPIAKCDIMLGLKLTLPEGETNLPPIPLAAAQIRVLTIPPSTWLAGSTVGTSSGLVTLGLGLFPGKPRYVNTSIVNSDKQTVPPKTELGRDQTYYVRIDIGPLSKQSVVRNPLPFPSSLLPQGKGSGYWLDAVVASDDFQLHRHRYTLFLPDRGPGWVCDCHPGEPHTCNKQTREKYLDIAIEPLKITPVAKLRIGIYYLNNLIQSQLLTTAIAETECKGQEFSSIIDYTLAKSIDGLSSFSPRTLNILTNDNNDGTHKIVLNGKLDAPIVFNFTEGQVRNAIGAVREKLRDLHLEKYGGHLGTKVRTRNRYDEDNAKPKAEFVKDLTQLASYGWLLWGALFKYDFEKGRELSANLLKAPGTIQVSRVRLSDFVFPWGAIYDIPLESDPKLFRFCRLVDEWERAETLITADPKCPYNDTHTRNTICPFGFWGFKHIIEQLPSMPTGHDVQRTIKVSKRPIELLAALSLDLDTQLSDSHLKDLAAKLSSTVKVIPYRSRKDLEMALRQPKVELVYFYCHGGREDLPGSDSPTPFLGIGKNERLTPSDLDAWAFGWPSGHWTDTSPLVFINGCHTAEITPESLVNFVDKFVGVRAAGVIGTEIVLDQRIANEAGATFFYYFKNQKCSVGYALQQVRRTFLLKGNLLGLVYTPYCSVDLQLS